MTGVFVTATGTEIGKTYVTSLLCRHYTKTGLSVRALKPVLSGYEPQLAAVSDSGIILNALGNVVDEDAVAAITPWRFRAPLSPDMAAAREGRAIDFAALVEFCRPGDEDMLIVEGVGGAMVPLTDTKTVLDWIEVIELPALVVAGSYLGTISHTLTTVSAMLARNVAVAGVVVSESESEPVSLAETVETIGRFLSDTEVVGLPRGATDCAEIAALIAS